MAALDECLSSIVEADLAAHCRVAGFEQGRLIIAADSAVWATRLRYHTNEILRAFNAAGTKVSACRIIILTPEPPPVPPPVVRPFLSATAARHIQATAAGITYEPLAEALNRLATKTRNDST